MKASIATHRASARRTVVTARQRRGATLVLVLWILIVVGAISARLVSETRRATNTAGSLRAAAAARHAAESGILAAAHTIERQLEAASDDRVRRAAILNRLDDALALDWGRPATVVLGDARAQVTTTDLSARFDLNVSTEASLSKFLSYFGPAATSRSTAHAIHSYIAAEGPTPRPIASLAIAANLPGVDSTLLARAAGDLTVDGDGQVNARSADAVVLAAATGGRITEPSRVLLISRGWIEGHPLTHEVQAVYAIEGAHLIFVKWREATR